MSGRGARVFGHPQIIKDQADIAGQFSHFLGYATYAFGFNDSNGESAESGDVFRTVAGADPTAIFIVIPIEDIVTAIFNGPVAPIHLEDALGIGLLGRSTGDAVSHFARALAILFVYELSFDDERLSDVGEIKVAVELGGGPDLSGFDSSMVRGRSLSEIWL